MISVRRATEDDIPVIEDILLGAVEWLDSTGNSLWTREQFSLKGLSRNYSPEDFFIAYLDGEAAGCMALVDHDPAIWQDIPKDGSLFIHKLAANAGEGI